MRRVLNLILCVAIVLGLLAGCAADGLPYMKAQKYDSQKINPQIIASNTKFAFDIFRQLNNEDRDKSIFISPLSISTALAMTYQGAGTTTRDAMAKVLGYDGYDAAKINETYQNMLRYLHQADSKIKLNISNSIWIRDGEEVKKNFIDVNKNIFDAYVASLDFSKDSAADAINGWISDSTGGLIKKMIEPPISPRVVMYLINAIYFKGEWKKQFDRKNSTNADFYSGDGSKKEVVMMRRTGKVEYGQGDGYKAVRLPYGKGKTSMYCILPEEGTSVNDFIDSMNPEKWKEIRDIVSETDDVNLQLPRFKQEYGIKNLNDSLISLGMGEAFSESADFSGIREGIFISRVLHKAVIEVNEEGSEAAGVTVVEMKETAASEPVTFIANRPFVYMIVDDETGTILFMGKMF